MLDLIPYLLVALFGIFVGSFLNVCILRIPAGEDIVKTPSHCPRCGKRLRWYELIPVLSYAAQRGTCRGCKAPISAQYPLIELANGALWVLCCAVLGFSYDTLLCCAMTSALLVLSVIDGRTQEIPPGINYFILALGVLRTLLDLNDWKNHVIGFFAVSIFLLVLALLGGMGGGDVKLMAFAGLFLGWKAVIFAFFLGCIAGAVIHVARMALFHASRRLAFGPYLAFGIVCAMLWAQPLIGWYMSLLSV